jgi:hypothetical protein
MHNVKFVEDGSSVVGDEGLSPTVPDHFVHAPGAETGTNAVGNG